MNRLLLNDTFRRLARIAVFAAALLEPQALSIDLPIVSYRPQRTVVVRPQTPEIVVPGDLPQGSIHLDLPLVSPRPNRTSVRTTQLDQDVFVPIEARIVVVPYTRPYRGYTYIVRPQTPEIPPSITLPEGSLSLTLPLVEYRKRHTRVFRPDISTENLPEADQTLLLPIEYEIRASTMVIPKTPENPIIGAIDEIMVARRSIWSPPPRIFLRPNLIRTRTPQIADAVATTVRNLPLLGVG